MEVKERREEEKRDDGNSLRVAERSIAMEEDTHAKGTDSLRTDDRPRRRVEEECSA